MDSDEEVPSDLEANESNEDVPSDLEANESNEDVPGNLEADRGDSDSVKTEGARGKMRRRKRKCPWVRIPVYSVFLPDAWCCTTHSAFSFDVV